MGGMPKRSSAPPTSRSSASPSSSSPGYSSRGPLSPYCAKIPELRSLTSKALGKSRSFWLACSGNTIPELMGNPIPELTGYPIPELTGKLGRIPRDPIPHSQLGISLLNPESRPVQLLWKKEITNQIGSTETLDFLCFLSLFSMLRCFGKLLQIPFFGHYCCFPSIFVLSSQAGQL